MDPNEEVIKEAEKIVSDSIKGAPNPLEVIKGDPVAITMNVLSAMVGVATAVYYGRAAWIGWTERTK